MKTILTMMMAAISITAMTQHDPIDILIDQHAGKDGYTTVLVNEDLFKLIAKIDVEDEDLQKLASQIQSIRIIANENNESEINFFNDLAVQIPLDEYNELMIVKDKDQDVQMLVKETNGIISEFLLLAGGKDNAVISIKGNIDLKTLGGLSDEMGIKQLSHLHYLKEE